MSSCSTVHEILESARDERPAPLVRSALEAHLASCPECAQLAVLEEQLAEGLSALREAEAELELPASFRREVKERLLAFDRRRAPRSFTWAWGVTGGLAAAACLALAIVSTLALREPAPLDTVAGGPAALASTPPESAGHALQPVSAPGSERESLDLSTAPLLYATPEVEVFYGGPRPAGLQPVGSPAESAQPAEDEPPQRREYHF